MRVMSLMRRAVAPVALAAVVTLAGCATTAPVNPPIQATRPDEGYRMPNLLKRHTARANDPHSLVLLAFSGGGTRAAALSYGVLEELRRTQITVNGHTHAAIDEVDRAFRGVRRQFHGAGLRAAR